MAERIAKEHIWEDNEHGSGQRLVVAKGHPIPEGVEVKQAQVEGEEPKQRKGSEDKSRKRSESKGGTS
jgi:hypothetical protein